MNERKAIIARVFLVFGIVLMLPVAIALQMLRIHYFEGASLRALWDAQAIDYVPITAQRGHILDAKDRIMVSNTISYSIAIDPLAPGKRDPKKPTSQEELLEAVGTLARITGRPAAEYQRRITQAPAGSRYILLERNAPRRAYDELSALKMRAVILEEQYKRHYNYNQLAAHTLGYVNHEIAGMMGLEAAYDSQLRGKDGRQQVQRDSRGRIRAIVGAPLKRPTNGYTLKTTLDAHIQAIAEEELRIGVTQSRARYGTVIVLDPTTGAVKALANYPTFNPNNPGTDEENRRNFAISDMIEPGSTFKLVTAAAALEQRVVTLDEVFETPASGTRIIHGQVMRDHDPLGTLTFTDVIKKSSNVATAEVAMRLSKETFYQYARNFGFGMVSGIDLPNEEAGRMQRPFNWSNVTLPWMSIGYEVQTTPLQVAMAYAAFANNGVLMRPYIVDEIRDENDAIVSKTRPASIRKVLREETVQALMPVFEEVVTEDGTAEFARIEGITIAGKTGTAQKYIDGRYQTRYRATFVGFYPTDAPKYVCIVVIDEPRTSIYGGYVSGPVFRKITSRIMGIDNRLQREANPDEPYFAYVPLLTGFSEDDVRTLVKKMNIPLQTEGSGPVVVQQEPRAGSVLTENSTLTVTLGKSGQHDDSGSVVPEVRGLAMREAWRLLTQAGYEVKTTGSGTVSNQFPAPGSSYQTGREVSIRGKSRSLQELVVAAGGTL